MSAAGKGGLPCPFCAIANGTAPARIVWRGTAALALIPDAPAVAGHTLVVPVAHVQDIWDVDQRTGRELADATLTVADGVRRACGTDALNVIQSNGAAAGQSVFHLHIHVVPRTDGDRMPRLWPPDAPWTPDQLDTSADLLRAVLARNP